MTARLSRGANSGLSILEVLFAILITSIGLMGAIAIFPAAILHAKRGMQQDIASSSGLGNIHTFDAMGMRQPDRWLQYNQASTDSNSKYQRVPVPDGSFAFCIDPRFHAAQMTNDDATTGDTNANNFPYGGSSIVQRVTLDAGFVVGPNNNPIPMRGPQADLNFTITDDLDYDRFLSVGGVPNDDLQAAQLFARDGSGNVLKRQNDGHLSWIATVAPKLERLPVGTGFIEDRYILSVVTLYDRANQMNQAIYPAVDWGLNVTFNSSGIGGGEVRLTEPDSDTRLPSDTDARFKERVRRLNVQRDQWIMLASYTQIGSGATARNCPLVRWYRVIDAAETDTSNWTVDVTLAGADWENTNQAVYAVVVQGAVGVVEKTIKLEPRL